MQFKNPPSPVRPRFFIPARIALVAMTLGASVPCVVPPSRAAEEVAVSSQAGPHTDSYRLFYDKLSTGGDWLQTDQYGYVFQPHVATNQDWRPYTDGYWAQTDSGWAWVSNEDFGWATYHYGRWANLVDVGWVWVPGSEWSPAFVSWRVSKDHKQVGWAPLPPEARLSQGQDVESWADSAYDIGPSAYVFIDTNHFGETSYRSHLLPVEQNVTIITETENVTRLDYRTVNNRSVIYAGGPDVAIIRAGTGRPVRELHLETRPEGVEFFEHGDSRGIAAVNGDRFVVAVAAPEVITSTSIRVSEPAHIGRRLSTVTVDRGYRGIGDPQAIERVRATLRSQGPPPPPQIEREASAAIRRDGAAVPVDQRIGGRNEPATAPTRDERRANTAPAPVNAGNERTARPEPGTPPNATERGPAPGTRGAPSEEDRNNRQHAGAAPAANQEASPARRENAAEASASSRREEEQANRRSERTNKPEASATPAKERTNPASERASSPPNAERHGAEGKEDRPVKPEATPRADRETQEKKSAPAADEAATPRHTPEQGREKPADRDGKEHAEKKETPESHPGEKANPTPKP